jgi:hypothetical protein
MAYGIFGDNNAMCKYGYHIFRTMWMCGESEANIRNKKCIEWEYYMPLSAFCAVCTRFHSNIHWVCLSLFL